MKQMDMLETEVQEHREAQREAIIFKVLRHSMVALSERALQFIALFATIGLFAWASVEPDAWRTVNASLFSVVFLIIFHKKGTDNANK